MKIVNHVDWVPMGDSGRTFKMNKSPWVIPRQTEENVHHFHPFQSSDQNDDDAETDVAGRSKNLAAHRMFCHLKFRID